VQPQIPNIAGIWTGTWQVGFPATVTLSLSQGDGGRITGNFTTLGSTIPIEGTVTSGLAFSWRNVFQPAGCGSLQSDMVLPNLNPQTISGTLTLNSTSCSPPGFFSGPLTLTRAFANTQSSTAGDGSLADLVQRLHEQ
jgi:hypothetical protein